MDIQDSVERLAELLLQRGKYEEAEALLWEFLDEGQSVLQEACRRRPVPCGLLGAALAAQQEFAEAEPLLLDAFEGVRTRKYASRTDTKISLGRLVNLYQSWDVAEPGTGLADRAIEYRKLSDAVSNGGWKTATDAPGD